MKTNNKSKDEVITKLQGIIKQKDEELDNEIQQKNLEIQKINQTKKNLEREINKKSEEVDDLR